MLAKTTSHSPDFAASIHGRDADNICTIGLLPLPNVLTAWTGDCVCRMFLFQGSLTNRTIFLPHIRLPTKSAGLSLLHRRDLRPAFPFIIPKFTMLLTVLTRERNGAFYHRATYNSSMLPQNFLNDIALEQLFSLEVIVGKRKRGVYRDDGKDRVKIKNPNYLQAEGRHELLKPK